MVVAYNEIRINKHSYLCQLRCQPVLAIRGLFTWKLSTFLAVSTRVTKRVNRRDGLTRVGRVNAYRRLTEKGLPVVVTEPR